jgi:hypothetical protein
MSETLGARSVMGRKQTARMVLAANPWALRRCAWGENAWLTEGQRLER